MSTRSPRICSDFVQLVCSGPKFVNLALKKLPVDEGSNTIRIVRDSCYTRVKPTPVDTPKLVAASTEAFSLLGIPTELAEPDACTKYSEAHQLLAEYLSGNRVWSSSDPAAHCYCGHQFGQFAGQLGDGAVIYLGEVQNEDSDIWELQLKGAGLTPFSRQADGRKVLRSSLREFLCSEAMYHLGIPTTRAASVVTSDSRVPRDVFYTGNIVNERISITSRLAPTFIRFGSFEICKSRDAITGREGPSFGNSTILPTLVDYVIERFYPDIWSTCRDDQVKRYLQFYAAVVKRTAKLVAHWQTVGFCHGVLNTDNMSIVGLTMDYGPFGFMDRFSWDHVCNTSDTDGRYSYAEQPSACAWNCARLADCLVQALSSTEAMEEAQVLTSTTSDTEQPDELPLVGKFRAVLSSAFIPTFRATYLLQMRAKLGLLAASPESNESDEELIKLLFDTMDKTGADFTNTFLALEGTIRSAVNSMNEDVATTADGECHQVNLDLDPSHVVAECCSLETLLAAYEPTFADTQREALMRFASIKRLALSFPQKIVSSEEKASRHTELKSMTVEQKRSRDSSLWHKWLSSYATRLKFDVEQLGEDAETPTKAYERRLEVMNSANPRFVLRNYLGELAIQSAEAGDFNVATRLLDRLRKPFESDPADFNDVEHLEKPAGPSSPANEDVDRPNRCRPPAWAHQLRVS